LGQIRHLEGVLEHDEGGVEQLIVGEFMRRECPCSELLLDDCSPLRLELKVAANVSGCEIGVTGDLRRVY
jgi:hypothetical protein